MSRILIVEDARPIAQGMRAALEQEGFSTRIVADGSDVMPMTRAWLPRLVILDLTLPTIDGIQVLRTLRSEGFTMPVVIVSARASEAERVRGLRIGADDYLVKPFGVAELLARVEAQFRREAYRAGPDSTAPNDPVELGKLCVDTRSHVASYDGTPIALRPREFDLLLALARRPGDVVSRTDLLREVWGYEADVETRTIDTHVVELRRKLDEVADGRVVVVTVRKVGYRLLAVA